MLTYYFTKRKALLILINQWSSYYYLLGTDLALDIWLNKINKKFPAQGIYMAINKIVKYIVWHIITSTKFVVFLALCNYWHYCLCPVISPILIIFIFLCMSVFLGSLFLLLMPREFRSTLLSLLRRVTSLSSTSWLQNIERQNLDYSVTVLLRKCIMSED